MADFLSRLAERTLGVASVIRPLTAPLFAPRTILGNDFPTDAAEEQDHSLPGIDTAHSSSSSLISRPVMTQENLSPHPSRRSTRPSSDDQIMPLAEGSGSWNRDEGTGGGVATDEVRRIVANAQNRADGGLQSRSGVTSARRQSMTSEEEFFLPSPLVALGEQLPSPRSVLEGSRAETATATVRLVSSSERKGHWSSEQAARQPERTHELPSVAPVIRVTIGRIEVRAITPPATTMPRSAPARPKPTLSLEEYLKPRNGRKG